MGSNDMFDVCCEQLLAGECTEHSFLTCLLYMCRLCQYTCAACTSDLQSFTCKAAMSLSCSSSPLMHNTLVHVYQICRLLPAKQQCRAAAVIRNTLVHVYCMSSGCLQSSDVVQQQRCVTHLGMCIA